MTTRLLAVCTHNRTRSVLMGALLADRLAHRGIGVILETAGFREGGLPPTDETVRLLAKRGIDVSHHQSQPIDADVVNRADIVLTAERQHVVDIASRWPDAFPRTFTLPELVTRAERIGPRAGVPLAEWLRLVNDGRPVGVGYLNSTDVLEIDDPTGRAPSVWRSCFDEVDGLARRLSAVLA